MALGWLGRVASREARGVHFAAVLFMGPLAAVAIAALRQVGLVSRSPVWLIPTILVGGQMLATATDLWWKRSPSRVRLHARIASQAIVVTATIYATGWGPGLAVGLVFVGQESLAVAGSSAQRAVLAWNLSCLAAGQGLLALGWVPSLLPVPEVHGLAVLMGVGIAFSYRSLTSALIEKEEAAALTERRERRFRALVQSSQDLVFVVDATRTVTYASPSCTKVLGYEPDVLLGTGTGILVHGDEIEALRVTIRRAAEVPGGTAKFSIRVRHADDTWRWIEGIATNLLDDPAVLGTVINARDITERRWRLERQAAIAALGRDALRATSHDAVVESATSAIIQMVEGCECRIVGVFEETHPVGLTSTRALKVPADNPDSARDLPAILRIPVGDPERPLAHIEIVKNLPATRDDEQFLEGVAGILLSSIMRNRAEDAIRHQAMHDPLTGLPNRTLFNDRLDQALSRRTRIGGYVAVMVVDLDGFKIVNDSAGHATGDALLIAVADRFRSSLREVDTIARLGGDEFALLVGDLDAPDQAHRVAQRALDALVSPLQLPERDVAIGASIGIALADRADNGERLLSNADAAMYRAKREGKGCYRVFETSMHTAAVERMELEQALRTAIANHSLTVHYQPVVDTRTGQVSSFEALARWHHPNKGFIPPDTFIPLAEESGLIIDLGRAVLIEACQQTKIWHTTFPHLWPDVAVNVSRLQLVHPSFVHDVADALAQAEIEPSSLTLEVTESVLAADSGRVISVLDELRRTGVRVAIDDFGTGYSSFAALAELPIDILKIDKRFVDHLLAGREGRGFVNAIMQLARTLHLEAIAEGVEQPEQRQALHELGCTHIQGFLCSPPMPADHTRVYLENQAAETVPTTQPDALLAAK